MKIIDLLREVSLELVDIRNVTWSKAEMLTYYNAAITFMVSARPDSYTRTEDFTCIAGTYQTLPSDSLRVIDVVCNEDTGQPINAITRSNLDNRFLNWYKPSNDPLTFAEQAEHFVYDDRSPREFYLYPAVLSGTVIRAIFSKIPLMENITNEEWETNLAIMPLSDAYIEPVKFYMLYRAYMKEATSQNIPKASQYLTSVQTVLGVKTDIDAQISPNKS